MILLYERFIMLLLVLGEHFKALLKVSVHMLVLHTHIYAFDVTYLGL